MYADHDRARARSLAEINREAYIYFGAGATVAWQMAMPGVGRGVAEHSRTLHRPLERLRATMGYVYAVSLGTDEDRRRIAAHVNRAHRPVRGEGYSAFDRDLQLWVAATLYRGALDVHELFAGPVAPEHRGSMYREAWAFGRTLQVDDAQWPPDVEAFDRWWQARLEELSVEPRVRAYMHAVLDGGNAPWYLRPAMPLQRFVTRGLLPPRLRELFGFDWSERDQRRWRQFQRLAPRLYWAAPRVLRHWPARYYLGQLRKPG